MNHSVSACTLVAITALCQVDAALAQDLSMRPIVPFLEGTDVFVSSDHDVRFEAAIFPHLVAWQNFDTLLDARVKESDRHIFWVISGTPAVRLKMFQSESAPVRTPSYMPRGGVQLIYSVDYKCGAAGQVLKRTNGVPECGESKPRQRPSVSLWEFHGFVGHHSNGQDGCLYEEQSRPEGGGPCEPSFAGAAQPGVVNKKDGSFSTNYVRAGVNWRRNWLGPVTADVAETVREVTISGEYQRQFHSDRDQEPFYSKNRGALAFSAAQAQMVRFCGARFSEAVGASVLLDRPVTTNSRLAVWAQVSCFPDVRGGWGFFVRAYSGQDYYNLGFLEDINQVQIGITFNQDGFFRFRPPR